MRSKASSGSHSSSTPAAASKAGLTVSLPSGEAVPRLGIGTWEMGERATERRREVAALQLAIDLGVSLVDTAEMYAEGGAEEVVGEAIAGRRDRVFVVSKVYPHNATRRGTAQACERSLRRLRVEAVDLYLLHWRGSVPLQETVEAMTRLTKEGKIRHWGVSNFDVEDLRELHAQTGGSACATDQVFYNLARRGVEWELLPWCSRNRMPVMAYSPIDQGRLARNRNLAKIAAEAGAASVTVALAWVLRNREIIAIPKAASVEHVRANRAALDWILEPSTLVALDAAFPPPDGPSPLATT